MPRSLSSCDNWNVHFVTIVQSPSRVQLLATPWTAAHQASLTSTISRTLLQLIPLSPWCYLTISSSANRFSSCLQSFPASQSFPVSQFFISGSQSIGASASASVLPMNIQDGFPLGLTGLISLLFKGLSRVFSSTIQKHQFFGDQPSWWPNSHIHTWLNEKTALTIYGPLLKKWCLLFNKLSRFVIAFLPRSKHLLILWLQSPSAEILEPKKIKSVTASTFIPSICHEMMGLDAMIFIFLNAEF